MAVAVLAFLYSMVALLVYLGYMHVYRDSDFGPMFVSMQLQPEVEVTLLCIQLRYFSGSLLARIL